MTRALRFLCILLVALLGAQAPWLHNAWAVNKNLETLGLADKATADQVHQAYQKLVKKYHPDHSPDDPDAERQLKEITKAYRELGSPRKGDKKWRVPQFPLSSEEMDKLAKRDFSKWKPAENSTSAYDAAFEFAARPSTERGLGYGELAAHLFAREMSEKYSRRAVLVYIEEYTRVMNLAHSIRDPNGKSLPESGAENSARTSAYEKCEEEAEIEYQEMMRAEKESAKKQSGRFFDMRCFVDQVKTFFGK